MVPGTIVPGLERTTQKAFLGLGFGPGGTPIDILPIYQISLLLPNFELLIVDEFLRLNGADSRLVDISRSKLLRTLETLARMYDNNPNLIFCSNFMNTPEYRARFNRLQERIEQDADLLDDVVKTIPKNKRQSNSSYPIHEFACVQYMIDLGFKLKIGPKTERKYDAIMETLGFDMDFAYLLDALALGTKTPDSVVHYVPNCRGPNNGQRVFFGEPEQKVRLKLQQSCDESLRYFATIASMSGQLLGLDTLPAERIDSLYGRKLKREAANLVLNNVVRPFDEATR